MSQLVLPSTSQRVGDPTVDAFSRLRVSNPQTIFDSKQLYDKQALFWDEEVSGAGASSSFDTGNSQTVMTVTNNSEFVIRQTYMRFNYQPGKSLMLFQTGLMSYETGVTKRIGYFTTNTTTPFDSNRKGYYWQNDGSAVSICIAKNGTCNGVNQQDWNIDKMDGSGASGITIDWSTCQIFFIDFEWLGVGRVRTGLVVDGKIYYVHEFNHANNVTSVYTELPNLPLRYEIRSTGGSGTLNHICNSVISEGGLENNGIVRGVDRSNTDITTQTDNDIYPVISIRLQSGKEMITVNPIDFSIMVDSTADFRWALYLNPTIAGTDAASWTALANSCIEYDVTRNNTNKLSGGTLIKSGYVESGGADQVQLEIDSPLHLGMSIDGTMDEFVLAVQVINGGAEDFYGALSWRELL